ncbi:MAG: DegV family protein [Eubacteriaceae bacterium]|nr:DegV family protein [Eubacteriaceae bacterium]
MGIRIISDTTSYIEQTLIHELNIQLVPLSVNFPDESFQEDQVNYDYFYNKITRDNVIPTSSQPSSGELSAIFREIAQAGDDIVAIFLSSAMSGTYGNACISKTEILDEFPDAKIEIIDSFTNCMALGIIVLEAARAARANAAFDEVVRLAIETRNKVEFYFTPKTLDFLRKGGRIGTASALLGSVLNINPILTVDMSKGMTHLQARVLGPSRALAKIFDFMAKDCEEYGIKAIYVHHINAQEKALEAKSQLESLYQGIPINMCSIGPVIGLHVGPGTIGVVYCTDKPKHNLG